MCEWLWNETPYIREIGREKSWCMHTNGILDNGQPHGFMIFFNLVRHEMPTLHIAHGIERLYYHKYI